MQVMDEGLPNCLAIILMIHIFLQPFANFVEIVRISTESGMDYLKI